MVGRTMTRAGVEGISMSIRVGVVGLGYIGLPLMAALASRGHQVIGIDVDAARVAQLTAGAPPPIHEPGVAEVLDARRAQLRFTTDYAELAEHADVVFVTVGTPFRDGVGADLSQIEAMTAALGAHLRAGMTVCLKSTVPPGTTRRVAAQLEAQSGLRLGSDFWVAFCPERTVEGRALEELLALPNIVGGIDAEATRRVAEAIGPLSGHIVEVASPELAEVAKLVDNSYRSLAIAFANEVGQICEGLGLDQYALRDAVMDGYSRTQLFRAGLAAAGPCLSKDPPVLAETARNLGLAAPVLDASVVSNATANVPIAERIEAFARAHDRPIRVALLGLAFKGQPETDDTRNGPAEFLHARLTATLGDRVEFSYYDPLVSTFAGTAVSSLRDAVAGADVVAVLTDHPALQGLTPATVLETTDRPLLVIDAWHNLVAAGEVVQAPDVELIRVGDGAVQQMRHA